MSTHDISIPYNGEKTTVSGSSGENYVFFDGYWNSSCDLCGVLGSTVPPSRLLLPGNRRLTARVCVAIRTLGHLIQELLHEFIAMYYLCLGFLVFADIIVVRSQGDLCLGGGDKDVVENLHCDHFQLGRWRWCARQCRSIKLDISVIVSVESTYIHGNCLERAFFFPLFVITLAPSCVSGRDRLPGLEKHCTRSRWLTSGGAADKG